MVICILATVGVCLAVPLILLALLAYAATFVDEVLEGS